MRVFLRRLGNFMGFINDFWQLFARIRSEYAQKRNPSLDYTYVTVIKSKDLTFKLVKNVPKNALLIFETESILSASTAIIFRYFLHLNMAILVSRRCSKNFASIFANCMCKFIADAFLIRNEEKILEIFCSELPFYSLRDMPQEIESQNLLSIPYFLTAYSFEVKRANSIRKKLTLLVVRFFNVFYYNILIPSLIWLQRVKNEHSNIN